MKTWDFHATEPHISPSSSPISTFVHMDHYRARWKTRHQHFQRQQFIQKALDLKTGGRRGGTQRQDPRACVFYCQTTLRARSHRSYGIAIEQPADYPGQRPAYRRRQGAIFPRLWRERKDGIWSLSGSLCGDTASPTSQRPGDDSDLAINTRKEKPPAAFRRRHPRRPAPTIHG